jgi:hypothetical protein
LGRNDQKEEGRSSLRDWEDEQNEGRRTTAALGRWKKRLNITKPQERGKNKREDRPFGTGKMVTGYRSQVTSHRFQIAGYKLQVTGYSLN